MTYKYKWLPGSLVQEDIIEKMSDLYSSHYGTWSSSAHHSAGAPIRLSPSRIRRLLELSSSKLAYAFTQEDDLVGYAIAIQTPIKKTKRLKDADIISWVTQLVVHNKHRNRGAGKHLLFSIWNFTHHYAWGLLTANPYAIRALEKATRRRCNPKRIQSDKDKLHSFAIKNITYVNENTYIDTSDTASKINTEFNIDHSNLAAMLSDVTSNGTSWVLGELEPGWEWFAFTFQDQEQIGLTKEEIESMLEASDETTKEAYSRMLLNSNHKWAASTNPEVTFILEHCPLTPETSRVLDIGCGVGRHSIEIARQGFSVTGVDYIDIFINRAQSETKNRNIEKAQFINADCRTLNLNTHFDLILCLYDVIGSYAKDIDNYSILHCIASHLAPGGHAFISVMNFELTKQKAVHTFDINKNPDALLELKPSNTMENTGNIFNPEYYTIEESTRLVYRKEQFSTGDTLPTEVIIRDRRYTETEITSLCEQVGLTVLWSRFVRAGDWRTELPPMSDHAKEILLFCQRAHSS